MNYLTYIRPAEPYKKKTKQGYITNVKKAVYKCCCGKEVEARVDTVNSNDKTSCGCQRNKHRKSRKPSDILNVWYNMRARCTCISNQDYKDYGGRGIKLCDRWMEKFENFLEDMGERPGSKYTIERIDNNGNYCPENCRWATRKEQSRNKRNVNYVEYNGEIKSVAEWSEIININYQTLNHRLYDMNWPVEDAFTIPPSLANRRHKR